MKLSKTKKLAKMTEYENKINVHNFVTINDILTCFLYPLEIKESSEFYKNVIVYEWASKARAPKDLHQGDIKLHKTRLR